MYSKTITKTESNRVNDVMYYVNTNNLVKLKSLSLINKHNVNTIIDNVNNYTALHYSLRLPDNNICQYLLEVGANPELKTKDGKDAYDIAVQFNKKYLYESKIKQKNDRIKDLEDDCVHLNKKIKIEHDAKEYLLQSVNNYQSQIILYKEDNKKLKEENKHLKENIVTLVDKNTRLNKSVDSLLQNSRK